jgi:hypothetical protein
MRPRAPPHAHTGVRTLLLPCAVNSLYFFSLSSLIAYSPRALKRVYANLGLFLLTRVSFFDSHAPHVYVFFNQ